MIIYECEFCKKIFANNSNLNVHKKTAKYCISTRKTVNVSEYKCEFCMKVYASQRCLSTHIKVCKTKKSEEILHIKAENDILHKKLADMETKLDSKTQELKSLFKLLDRSQSCVEEIAKQPRVSNNTTKNKILLSPLDLSEGRLKSIVDTNFTRNHLLEGQKGVARFTFDHVLKDDQGKLTYVCTDASRHSYKYITEDGDEIKDVKGKKLTSALYPSVIDRSRAIVNEGINDQPTNFPLYTDSFIDIKEMGVDNSDFRAELASMTS